MRSTVKSYLQQLKISRGRRRKVLSLLLALSLLVSSGVFWQLRLIGIALTGETVYCGIDDHEHTLACTADRSADLETKADWEATMGDLDLAGDWPADLLAVAETQLSYGESQANFEVAEDGVSKNAYSRYGEWGLDPYGDWNGLFVSFALAHAQIPSETVPSASNIYNWSIALDEQGLYRPASAYEPKPGDLMFFDLSEDGKADRIAIVKSAESVSGQPADQSQLMIHAIEGDKNGLVAETAYDPLDSRVLGYGSISGAYEAHLDATAKEAGGNDPAPDGSPALPGETPGTDTVPGIGGEEVQPATESAPPIELPLTEPGASDSPLPSEGEIAPGEVPGAPIDSNEPLPAESEGIAGEVPIDDPTDPVSVVGGSLLASFELGDLKLKATRQEGNLYLSTLQVTYTHAEIKQGTGSFQLEYSDDGGSNWFAASPPMFPAADGQIVLAADRMAIDGSWTEISRQFRVFGGAAEQGLASASFGIRPILDQGKPDFSNWLETAYVQEFAGSTPQLMSELFQAFDRYRSLVSVTISQSALAESIELQAATDIPGDFHYEWQRQDDLGQWVSLSAECTVQLILNDPTLADLETIQVRVKISLADGILGISPELTVDTTTLKLPDPISAEPVVLLPTDPLSEPDSILDPQVLGPDLPQALPGLIPELALVPTIDTISASFSNLAVTATRNSADRFLASMTAVFTDPRVLVGKTYTLNYSDNGGATWIIGSAVATATAGRVSVTASPTVIGSAWTNQQRLFRVVNTRDPIFSASFSLRNLLNGSKPGFVSWLGYGYLEFFNGQTPVNVADVFTAFDQFSLLPAVLLKQVVSGLAIELQASVSPSGQYSYIWQYQDPDGSWLTLPVTAPALSLTGAVAETLSGGKTVRCLVYEGGIFKNTSEPIFAEPRQVEYDQAIPAINTKLGLASYGPAGKDLTIGGYQFNNLFYYGNVAGDPMAPFSDAASYKKYLAMIYLDQGEQAVRAVWERYFYDLYDPTIDLGNSNGGSGGTGFPYPGTYGDTTFTWPKDAGGANSTPFHTNDPYADIYAGTKTIKPSILPLNFDYLEKGVDYANFVTGVRKTATGILPGDANKDRLYDIAITADAQAKIKAPVALILQVQTSWQMFDLGHANKLDDGTDGTGVGAASYNTQLANLYDTKKALLRLVDYMDQKYPGNNLVMGITDVEHAGSFSMFQGLDALGKPLYVTNDSAALKAGIIGWDTFGNCEHVHYSTTALQNAITNLASNLTGWKDVYGVPLTYDQIRKVGVVIGGPTENSSGTSGYGVTLPWTTFQTAKLNSVYGIRTNQGTPLNPAGIISWIDYSGNTTGTAFKDGTGSSYTQRFVASNEDVLFRTLVNIVEKEMVAKAIDVVNPTTPGDDRLIPLIENLTLEDVVADEFRLNWDSPIKATVYLKDGVTVIPASASIPYPERIFNQADAVVTTGPGGERITKVAARTRDGTLAGEEQLVVTETFDEATDSYTNTTLSFNFGTVENTRKAVLAFRVEAKEDYIGSNNVFTNVGTPAADYDHTPLDQFGNPAGTVREYSAPSFDTPQVNVPIRFATVDGEQITLFTGETVDLEDLSDAIVADAEYRATLYSQISGSLQYKWTMPDGTTRDLGSVAISDGTAAGSFPDRTAAFTGTSPGAFQGVLSVTFTPLATIDPTRVAVARLTNTGKVWIDVISDTTKLKRIIRKEWPGGSGTQQSVSFQLVANGEPLTETDGTPKTYTLTKTADWKTLIQDLPASRTVNGQKIALNYTVREVPIPNGYNVSYAKAIQTDPVFAARLRLTMTSTNDIADTKQIAIAYNYGGVAYTYSPIKIRYLKNTAYTFVIPNLPLDPNGAPYPVTITRITVDGTTLTYPTVTATTEKVQTGTVDTPVLVIRNTPSIVLPQTGGPGTAVYTLGGLLLMAGALMYRYRFKRRQKRRSET